MIKIGSDGKSVTVNVYVQPGAKKSKVVGEHDGALKIAITAPPVGGKANIALVEFFSDALGIPKKRITIIRGEKSRHKVVRIDGVGEGDLLGLV